MSYEHIVPTEERIQRAVDLAVKYGQIDGAHHRVWVIDQMLRRLTGDYYTQIIAEVEACDGEWDTGVAP